MVYDGHRFGLSHPTCEPSSDKKKEGGDLNDKGGFDCGNGKRGQDPESVG
jgi:hypothetical protein